jgi:hypothetical protein
MSNKTSNLVKLAKGSSKKPAPVAKKPVVKEVEKPKTPEEERDLKAKQKVEELLQDVDLSLKKEDELLEIEEPKADGSIQWLEEQVSSLSAENELLRNELAAARGDLNKVMSGNVHDDGTRDKVRQLFHELQSAHLSMGFNPATNAPNLIIAPIAFMNRLILFFPFLEKEKRY